MLGCTMVKPHSGEWHWVAAYDNIAYYGNASIGVSKCSNIPTMPDKMPLTVVNKYTLFTTTFADMFGSYRGAYYYLVNFYVMGELKYAIYRDGETGNKTLYWYNKCDDPLTTSSTGLTGKFLCELGLQSETINALGLFDCVNHYFKKFESAAKLIA
ncbi:hypothetical protein PRJ_Dakar_00282 [Faustovirus]|nr:hypothetical protein PRJ_Dakar_00282 [Faustovirus]